MKKKFIYADFNGVIGENILLLDGLGTKRDLEEHNVQLRDGLELTFYEDDLDEEGKKCYQCVDGIVKFDNELDQWIAMVDWSKQYFSYEK